MKKQTALSMGTKRTGFTIVELLIVVVVIAILAAITIVAYNGITQRAAQSAAQSAVSQAQKKLLAWQVDNNNAIPPSLDALGLSSGSAQYQYSTSANGFCITATQDGRAAFVGNNYVYGTGTVNQSSPSNGACPGHSPTNANSPLMRNLATNPSFELGTTGFTTATATATQSSGVWADSGTYSIRVTNTGTTNAGDFRISNTAANMPFGMEPGKTYTISVRFYFTAAPTGNLTRAPGILYWYSTNGSGWNESFGPKAPTTPGTYTLTHTVTVPSNATGVLIAFGAASTTANQNFYYDSFMIEEGSVAHTYADGDTPNWIWLGTPHASASSGPAL